VRVLAWDLSLSGRGVPGEGEFCLSFGKNLDSLAIWI
jgi:hypothetical protein